MATLAAAGVTLRNQINEAFPGRDKASDGWIGDAAHQARVSDHNPDRRGIVHAIDVDEDLAKNVDARELADELVELARTGEDGGRLKYVVYEDQVASGTYRTLRVDGKYVDVYWRFRGHGYGHTKHLHVSFTEAAEHDASPFPLRCLGVALWDGVVPSIEKVRRAALISSASIGVHRVACRLYDLGHYQGRPQRVGVQKYPVKAVQALQEAVGLPGDGNYTDATHNALFGG